MSSRLWLCAALVIASSTSAMAANDGIPSTNPGAPPMSQSQTGQSQMGPTGQPGAPACRQAKVRPQLTAEQKAQRKALRAQQAAQGITHAAKPHAARLPIC